MHMWLEGVVTLVTQNMEDDTLLVSNDTDSILFYSI